MSSVQSVIHNGDITEIQVLLVENVLIKFKAMVEIIEEFLQAKIASKKSIAISGRKIIVVNQTDRDFFKRDVGKFLIAGFNIKVIRDQEWPDEMRQLWRQHAFQEVHKKDVDLFLRVKSYKQMDPKSSEGLIAAFVVKMLQHIFANPKDFDVERHVQLFSTHARLAATGMILKHPFVQSYIYNAAITGKNFAEKRPIDPIRFPDQWIFSRELAHSICSKLPTTV